MEHLLKEFKEAQIVLRKQLKDRERRAQEKNAATMEDDDERKKALRTAEDELMDEMLELLDFVKNNSEAIENYNG